MFYLVKTTETNMANWDGISEFVAVAETNGFTSAAKKLNTSVAHISRRVAGLETRLATKLLNRTTRKITLTEAGILYLEHCRKLVEGLENAELSLSQLQSSPEGKLTVTAPVAFGERHIAPIINDFMAQYLGVRVELILSNDRLDFFEHGIDVAIRLGNLEDSSFIAKKLGNRQLFLCAHQSYLEKYGSPTTLSSLKSHRCLVGSIDHWRFEQNGQEKLVKINGVLTCNSGPVLLDAVHKGLGIAQLPGYYVKDDFLAKKLVEVLPSFRPQDEGIWALYPDKKHMPMKIKLFIEFIANNLKEKQ